MSVKRHANYEPFIRFTKDLEDYSYKTWTCRHGQRYYYQVESEKWKVIHFCKDHYGYLGCDCEVPCSPQESKALLTLERHLEEISQVIEPCCPNSTSTVIASWPGGLVVLQCDQCGNPRTIKPIEIWNELEAENDKKREIEHEQRDAKNRAAHFKESIKMLLQNREYYNKNKETLIEEAKKQKELEISQRISYFDKELKEYKEKLKKLNQVIKNGGQAKLF